MAIEYTWTIAQLERNTADGGVIVAHWRVSLEDGDYTASSYGTQGFEYDATATDFTPYDQLTEAQVLQWVFDAMGEDQVAAIQDGLQASIDEQKAPTTEAGTPWAAE